MAKGKHYSKTISDLECRKKFIQQKNVTIMSMFLISINFD